MDPNQQGQPTQGGSVPPTSSMPGIPPEQTSGIPPASTDMQSTSATQPTSPVFSTGPATSPATSPQPSDPAPSSMPFTARRFSQSAGPSAFQPAQQTITSNTGSAAPKKGLSKGMIIGLIAIAILAIAAVVTGIIVSQSSGSKSSTASTTSAPINMAELTTAYNNLANYIAFGDEGTSEKKLSDGKTYTTYELLYTAANSYSPTPILYADQMLDTEKSMGRDEYFSHFQQLYQKLPTDLLYGHGIKVGGIYDYYYGFSTIGFIPVSRIISRYNTDGFDSTRAYIDSTVKTNFGQKAIVRYADYLKTFDLAVLNLINDVKVNAGCQVEVDNKNNCNLSAATSYNDYEDAMSNVNSGEAYNIKNDYSRTAKQALLAIYEMIYGQPEEAEQ